MGVLIYVFRNIIIGLVLRQSLSKNVLIMCKNVKYIKPKNVNFRLDYLLQCVQLFFI